MSNATKPNYKATCLNGTKPACSGACPFHMDIPGLMQKCQKGLMNAAYKSYRDAVVFPALVSRLCTAPCRNACLRREVDTPVSLLELEQGILARATAKDPTKNIAVAKDAKVAVIGAGLAGMALTHRLAVRGFPVTVFEKTDKRGGVALTLLPEEDIAAELDHQMFAPYEIVYNHEVTSLDELSDFAIICIATGAGGNDFGMRKPDAEASFLGARDNVFFAGQILGLDLIAGMGQAISFIPTIEMLLQNNEIKVLPPEAFCEGLTSRYVTPEDYVPPADGVYTKEELMKEAARCIKCNCTLCRDQCEFLAHHYKIPHELDAELSGFVSGDRQFCKGNRMINSCNMCGFCGANCPAAIDTTEITRQQRQDLVEIGKMPSFAEFFLRDMDFSHHDARLLISPAGDKTEYLFFPGCQLGASDPRYVTEVYAWLNRVHPNTALLLDCCSITAEWAGDAPRQQEQLDSLRADWEALGKPKVVLACGNCQKTFAARLPEMELVSLYTMLAEEKVEVRPLLGKEAAVFDPCGFRYDEATQDSVRALAESAGTELEELFFSRKLTKCCSVGGHMVLANPALADEIVDHRIHMSEKPYITYCTNCRDVFSLAGKPCAHVLEMVFPIDRDMAKLPTLDERRANRLQLKETLKAAYPEAKEYERKEYDMDCAAMTLVIPEEIAKRMEKELILEQDVKQVIRTAEETGVKLVDPEAGTFIAHLQIGRVTFWTEYKPAGENRFEILSVYSHRLQFT